MQITIYNIDRVTTNCNVRLVWRNRINFDLSGLKTMEYYMAYCSQILIIWRSPLRDGELRARSPA